MRLPGIVTLGCVVALSACGAAPSADGGVGGGAGGAMGGGTGGGAMGGGGGSDAGCPSGDTVDLSTGAVTLEDDLSGVADRVTPSCAATGRPDRIVELELGAAEDLFVQVSSSTWQPVIALYPLDACHAELQCAAANLQGQTSLTGTALAGGRYALVVDGTGTSPSGAYELYVERPAVQPVALVSGAPVTGLAAGRGAWRYFSVTLPSAGALTVTTSGGTGNADLYLARAKPTTSAFLQKSTAAGDDESVTESNAVAATWIVGVYAKAAYAGVTLVATW